MSTPSIASLVSLVWSSVALAAGLALAIVPPARGAPEPVAATIDRDGLKLEMAPLEPDQVRAFFLARGFNAEDADLLVREACLFRSAIGNAFSTTDGSQVTVTLGAWRITPRSGGPRQPRTREDWETLWKARGASEEAQVAFYWALFPTEQTFAPTDHNWGMITFGLPPATRFALDVHWQTGETSYSHRFEDLACAR